MYSENVPDQMKPAHQLKKIDLPVGACVILRITDYPLSTTKGNLFSLIESDDECTYSLTENSLFVLVGDVSKFFTSSTVHFIREPLNT